MGPCQKKVNIKLLLLSLYGNLLCILKYYEYFQKISIDVFTSNYNYTFRLHCSFFSSARRQVSSTR